VSYLVISGLQELQHEPISYMVVYDKVFCTKHIFPVLKGDYYILLLPC